MSWLAVLSFLFYDSLVEAEAIGLGRMISSCANMPLSLKHGYKSALSQASGFLLERELFTLMELLKAQLRLLNTTDT